jgi:hypothetical protein
MKQPLIAPRSFFPELQTYLNVIAGSFESIPSERKADLERVADVRSWSVGRFATGKVDFYLYS